jgi:hypothetical protein
MTTAMRTETARLHFGIHAQLLRNWHLYYAYSRHCKYISSLVLKNHCKACVVLFVKLHLRYVIDAAGDKARKPSMGLFLSDGRADPK